MNKIANMFLLGGDKFILKDIQDLHIVLVDHLQKTNNE